MIDPDKFLKFVKSRRSIRSFDETPIPDKEINMILEAGRWAPSASNRQPWEFIVIKNKEILKGISKLASYAKFIEQSSAAIAIIGKKKTSPKWYLQDTSLVSMNMMLMAWSLNIGTCWIGTLNREKAKELLKVSKDDFLLTILPLGYIKGEIPQQTYRKDLDKIKRELA
ncbi:MAG: nitroreductase family protein [Candidatus Hodarchaeota archaeon]